jgi:hypothetical protein
MHSPTTTTRPWTALDVDAVEQVVELAFAQLNARAIRTRTLGHAEHVAVETLVTQDEMLARRSLRPSLCS